MIAPAAAVAFAVLLGLLAVFQAALVAGAPLGRFAWGGRERVLPVRTRIGSGIAIALYAMFAVVALLRAGVVGELATALPVVIAMWVVTAYLGLGTLLNAISKSPAERFVMTPVALVLAILALVVALGR